MKQIRVISAIILSISVFISIDLGINCIGALIPELQDGIAYNSLLQSWFGILEDTLRTRTDFFDIFRLSLLVTFVIFIENIALSTISALKK